MERTTPFARTESDAESDARSDEDLMHDYALGDEAAFLALFGRYQTRAYAYLLRRTRCETRAADLYQELFLRLHRARAEYDQRRPFAPWFFQIARNLWIDDTRRAWYRAAEPLEPESIADPRATAREPERAAATAEQTSALLDQLSSVERRVLIGSKVEGRTHRELASELGRTTAAVKKLASRALQRLRGMGSISPQRR